MSEDEYRKVFVRKLAYYMQLNGKNQIDLMHDLGLKSATVSSWCTGKKLPRMDKIQLLADYFHIEKSDLLEDKVAAQPEIILNAEEKELVKSWRSSSAQARRIVAYALGFIDIVEKMKNEGTKNDKQQ